jgi:ribose transport system substrate-binding protein
MGNEEKKVNRRDYLKYTGAAIGGLVVGGALGYVLKPSEVIEKTATITAPGATVTVPGAVSTVTVPKTVTATPTTLLTPTITGTYAAVSLSEVTAFQVFMNYHSSDDWWNNAPKIDQYKKKPPYKIGFITSWRGEVWQETAIAEFKREATRWKNAGLLSDYVHMDSAGSIDTEISSLESMFTMWKAGGLDGILVDPLDPKALNSTIEKIYDSGCPIILWNNPADTVKYTSFVINDDWAYGIKDAEWLAKQLNYKGDIFFFRGLKGYPIDYARSESALSVFKKYPDIHIVAIDYGEWSYDKAKELFLEFVSAHPKFDGIYSVGGQMSNAILDAMIDQKINLKVPHASEDNNGFMQRCIKYGIPACASAHPSIPAAVALDLMIMLLQGYPVPKIYFSPQPFYVSEDFPKYVRPNVPEGVFISTPLPDDILNKVLLGEWKNIKWIPETA